MALMEEKQKLSSLEYRKAQEEKAKAKKEMEQVEKQQKEKAESKQYEKDLTIAIENDLKSTFERCFEREGFKNGYINLSLKVTRDEIIAHVGKNVFEKNWIDNNYEKVLQKVKKIYENDQKAKQQILQETIQEQEKPKHMKDNIFKFLRTMCNLIFSPLSIIILFLILFIWGYFEFAIPILNG